MIDKKQVVRLLEFMGENMIEATNDIRSCTIDYFYAHLEDFLILINLIDKINDLSFMKSIINDFQKEDIGKYYYSSEGMVKDALFIKCFIQLENHINQIADFYGQKYGEIIKDKSSSILKTFDNLLKSNNCTFFSNLTKNDKNLFKFSVI